MRLSHHKSRIMMSVLLLMIVSSGFSVYVKKVGLILGGRCYGKSCIMNCTLTNAPVHEVYPEIGWLVYPGSKVLDKEGQQMRTADPPEKVLHLYEHKMHECYPNWEPRNKSVTETVFWYKYLKFTGYTINIHAELEPEGQFTEITISTTTLSFSMAQ